MCYNLFNSEFFRDRDEQTNLKSNLKLLTVEEEELYDLLSSAQSTAKKRLETATTSQGGVRKLVRKSLLNEEIDLLNWLGREVGAGALGSAWHKAISEQRVPVAINGGTINQVIKVGSPSWLDELNGYIQEISPIIEIAEKIEKIDFTQALDTIEEYRNKIHDWYALREELEKNVVEKLKDISGPINELMDNFTPASWAYPEVITSLERGFENNDANIRYLFGNEKQWELDKIFNIGEIQTFVIALFLAGTQFLDRKQNVIILDDPFENLDEISIIYIIRGLGKLIRCFPIGHAPQMIIFTHSEYIADVLKFEVPLSFYRLPWLSFLGNEDTINNPITHQPLKDPLKWELQDIDAILNVKPKMDT